MTDAVAEVPEEETAKSSKLPMILGVVLALVGGGGGYFAVSSGILPLGGEPELAGEPGNEVHQEGEDSPMAEAFHGDPEPLPQIAYVPLEPIVVTLLKGSNVEHLRFRAQLEVAAEYQSDVETILPRVIDMLNGYLRALEVKDFEDPMALTRLRAQMLRRIQVVTGRGRVRDLLIMDFVLN